MAPQIEVRSPNQDPEEEPLFSVRPLPNHNALTHL